MNLHIVKYAKGHYGNSCLLSNLSALISKWSGWTPDEVSLHDIFISVYEVWKECCKGSAHTLVLDLFNKDFNIDASKQFCIEVMLLHIRWIKVENLPKNYDGMFFGSQESYERLSELHPDWV